MWGRAAVHVVLVVLLMAFTLLCIALCYRALVEPQWCLRHNERQSWQLDSGCFQQLPKELKPDTS